MGSSIAYIQAIVLVQAALTALLGLFFGIGLFLPALPLSRDTPLLLTITPRLIIFVTLATIMIGLISSMGAILKLHHMILLY